MEGSILDVHPEGGETFRACVMECVGGDSELARVVSLKSGETSYVCYSECGEPIINDVLNMGL